MLIDGQVPNNSSPRALCLWRPGWVDEDCIAVVLGQLWGKGMTYAGCDSILCPSVMLVIHEAFAQHRCLDVGLVLIRDTHVVPLVVLHGTPS